ncbi:MAG: YkgJ family cysteine cluster protein [Eubacteriales bacterium]
MILNTLQIEKVLSPLENKGVFKELETIYGELPETECERCATCCTVPPPGYLLEFLNLYRFLKTNLLAQRAEIMKRVAEYYFLEMADIKVKCPFLSGDNDCLVYPVRPLSCRSYGLKKGKENDDNEAMKRTAQYYREKHGIELPQEIVQFRLPANCEKVKVARGKPLKSGDIERVITDLAKLEMNVAPAEYVEQDLTLMPFATYLALTVLGEGARSRRLKVMKEYLEKGSSPLLEEYKEKAAKFTF